MYTRAPNATVAKVANTQVTTKIVVPWESPAIVAYPVFVAMMGALGRMGQIFASVNVNEVMKAFGGKGDAVRTYGDGHNSAVASLREQHGTACDSDPAMGTLGLLNALLASLKLGL